MQLLVFVSSYFSLNLFFSVSVNNERHFWATVLIGMEIAHFTFSYTKWRHLKQNGFAWKFILEFISSIVDLPGSVYGMCEYSIFFIIHKRDLILYFGVEIIQVFCSCCRITELEKYCLKIFLKWSWGLGLGFYFLENISTRRNLLICLWLWNKHIVFASSQN